jgi:DNA-binding PadR family transcriptional regulator
MLQIMFLNMFISENNKKTFKSIVLLDEMVNGSHQFQTIDNGDDSVLEPLFIELMSKGYVKTSGINYQITDKGQQVLDTFMKRYTEYLKVYDVFSFVDLENGEFAFARYYDFDSDDAWADFTNDERFDDLRIAVALFKKLDPAEIVFMSFINEDRFDTKSTGWQMDLLSDNLWKEIEEICQTAIKPEEVGQDAMLDMIGQGAELMIKLMEEEKQQEQNNNNYEQGTNTIVEEETVEYYQPYYDPYYVSPIWLLPLFLW